MIAEDPPTFEEAMAHKEATEKDTAPGASKESFFQRIKIKAFTKKEDDKKDCSDFIINEAGKQDEKEIITKSKDEEEIPPLNCFKKFINMLKVMSALITIISDLVLWACGIGILILGCYITKNKFELIQHLQFHHYHKQFMFVGKTFIVFGSIYILLVVPFGILGTWLHKRKLLKMHNMCLILSLLVEGFILYILFRQLYKTKHKEVENDFITSFTEYYLKCTPDDKTVSKTGICCCTHQKGDDETCWDYVTDMERGELDSNKARDLYYFQCTNNTSLLVKVTKIKEKIFFYFLPIFMGIQIIALFFGWLTVRGMPGPLPLDETDSMESIEVKKIKSYRKKPKLNLFYKVLIFFVMKRIFIILFFMLFALLVAAFRAYAKTKKVYIDRLGEQDLWSIMSALFFGMIQSRVIRSQEPPNLKKRKRYTRRPKNKLHRMWMKSTHLVYRRLLICFFGIVFVFSIIFLRLWYNNFIVKVGQINFDVANFTMREISDYFS